MSLLSGFKHLFAPAGFCLRDSADRRTAEQCIAARAAADRAIERRWRAKVAANPKEVRRLNPNPWTRTAIS